MKMTFGTRRTLRVTAALLVCGMLAASATTAAADAAGQPWTGGWEAGMTAGGPSLSDQTVRMVVHTNVAGQKVRLRLSNAYGSAPLVIGAVNVAVRTSGGSLAARTRHKVTFHGATGAVIPAGSELSSDAVDFTTAADEDLLVSVYLPKTTGPATFHSVARDTSYISRTGDHTADTGTANYPSTTSSWYFLDGLDILSPRARGTLVAFGDSITDGWGSSPGTNTRWPDDLARRLAAQPCGSRLGVVNAGISGNRVLTDAPAAEPELGVSGLDRFTHDALGEPRVRSVILLEGINDIGNNAGPDGKALTARDLIDGYRALIAKAHAAHVRIYGGTLLPYKDAAYTNTKGGPYYTAAGDAIRQKVNHWIRTSHAFDGTIDFAKTMADPSDPLKLLPAYDSGDHLHPNSVGDQTMADAIDLAQFR
ncbi:SGNH/GDSL hydrolase family protein [Streptomyces sp. TUS-ST3]|uniref:SGNH/GDSL hydrolase family protein n=1 Tax=Streptomyces sp. TUS-ST3 TaxID=3025591 RepID=UPI0024E180C4|nr:SGNH/GDSL hydrolase family protein [Streptomyces sp. TUS-ST3]